MLINNGGSTVIDTLVATLPNNNPSLTSHTIDMTFGTVGFIYGFKLRAYNHAGSIESSALNVALASLPSKPTNPPISDATITRQDRIGILIETFTSGNDGGSFILSYDIQFDDGQRGNYRDVY